MILYLLTILSVKLRNSFAKQQLLPTNHKVQKSVIEENEDDDKGRASSIEQESLLNNLKSMFIDWLISPYFVLHLCRLLAILMINYYKSFVSSILFCW
jgi:hypothetical protein